MSRPTRDAHHTSQKEIIEALVEIVSAEGPMIASRAYTLYVQASGGRKVGKQLRGILDKSVHAATQQGKLDQVPEPDLESQAARTLIIPGTPEVVVRERGPRDLHEIPRTEVAALMRGLITRDPRADGRDLCHQAKELYERRRLTASAEAYLRSCLDLGRKGMR